MRNTAPEPLVNSRMAILLPSADPPRRCEVAAVLLAAGHPDVVNPTKAMYMSVLVLCKLDDGLQHLPLENVIAPQLLPVPNPASSPCSSSSLVALGPTRCLFSVQIS